MCIKKCIFSDNWEIPFIFYLFKSINIDLLCNVKSDVSVDFVTIFWKLLWGWKLLEQRLREWNYEKKPLQAKLFLSYVQNCKLHFDSGTSVCGT